MKYGVPRKYLTLATSILAYFSNAFIMYLPFVITKNPYLELSNTPTSIVEANAILIIFQHLGTFIGTIVFSLWADRKGRLFILFFSIFLYSIGTLCGGLVDNYYLFVGLRFVVGLGLGPELGIGLVLVCEIFPRNRRSLIASIIAFSGFFAIFLLSFINMHFAWRDLYIAAGICGLLVMLTRFGTFESDLFLKFKNETHNKSNFIKTIKNPKFLYLLACLLPVYIITASNTFISYYTPNGEKVTFEKGLIPQFFTMGAMLGFMLWPLMSLLLKSRKKMFRVSLIGMFILMVLSTKFEFFFNARLPIVNYYLAFVATFGFLSGYLYEIFVFSIEQFGTNIRGGAITLLFGLGRSSIFVFSLIIPLLNEQLFDNYSNTVFLIELFIFSLAFWASTKLPEVFNKDLDFRE